MLLNNRRRGAARDNSPGLTPWAWVHPEESPERTAEDLPSFQGLTFQNIAFARAHALG